MNSQEDKDNNFNCKGHGAKAKLIVLDEPTSAEFERSRANC